jgi:hypothetical protein
MHRSLSRALIACTAAAAVCATATGWGGEGHEAVTYLALDAVEARLGDAGPAWLYLPNYRDRAAFESNTPDRRRAVRTDFMRHENDGEHYLDADMLADFGMTLRDLPRLRYEFVARVMQARAERPADFEAWDREDDSAMVYLFPGFAPYAAMEAHAKLTSAFRVVRILEEIETPTARQIAHLEQSRAEAVHHIGALSHWIGDLAQPLHTTIHHHGWVGPNPEGYTTEYAFHAYIDSGVLDHHGLVYSTIKPLATVSAPEIDPADPWPAVLWHIEDSFSQLERTYRYERDGVLTTEWGKRFICDRLAHGAGTLAGLIAAAWEAAAPTDDEREAFWRYEAGSPMGGTQE